MALIRPPSPSLHNVLPFPMPGAPPAAMAPPFPMAPMMPALLPQAPAIDPMTYPLEVPTDQNGVALREIEHAKSWEERIKTTLKHDGPQFKRMEKWRTYAAGQERDHVLDTGGYGADDEEEDPAHNVINLTHATFRALLPATAARNPETAVSPAERIDEEEYKQFRGFAQTGQILINHSFRSGSYKKQLRRTVVAANTTGVGWMKVTYQRDYWRDPMIQGRIDDAQDNLARLKQLIADTDPHNRDFDPQETDVKMAELDQVVRGLQERVEVQLAEGFVFDRCKSEDVIVDEGVDELEDYLTAEAITHRRFIEEEEAARMYGLNDEQGRERLKKATRYYERADRAPTDNGEPSLIVPPDPMRHKMSADKKAFVCVFEIWCRSDRTVYTKIAGMDGWAREPWRPTKTGRRWYPFFLLMFNEVDGARFPLSDTQLMAGMVDRYNDSRRRLKEHRDRAIPIRVGKRGDISDDDAKAINSATALELVLINGPDDDSKPISSSIEQLAYPPIDPGLYDVTQDRMDLDQVVGTPDLYRGAQMGERTATAAAIQNEGMQARTTDRQDVVEDYTQAIAEYVLQVALHEMTYAQVSRIAGKGTVWPGMQITPTLQYGGMVLQEGNEAEAWVNELGREDIYDLVMVEIRAGSTGRPNRQLEQQNWLKLWPIISQTMLEVFQMRMAGQLDLANAKVELMKEMLRRLDERIDVERFIPSPDPMAALAQPGAPPGAPGAPAGPSQPGAAPGLITPPAPPMMAAA